MLAGFAAGWRHGISGWERVMTARHYFYSATLGFFIFLMTVAGSLLA
jgi:hypothetical protein